MRGRVLEGKYIPSRWMQQGLQTKMASIKETTNPMVSRAGRTRVAAQLNHISRVPKERQNLS